MERVTTILGEEHSPIIIVCPHGYDDPNTSVISEQIANELGCYAVINNGWERATIFDYDKDKCNCNDINHLHEAVVKQEFLDPLCKYVNKIENFHFEPAIFIIHGVGSHIRKNNPNLDIIIGYGKGEQSSSHTCSTGYKNLFNTHLTKQGFRVYDGKPGGKYSARSKSNLTQFFRLWQMNQTVSSLQLEIVSDLRKTADLARKTGMWLSHAILDTVETRYDPSNGSEITNWPEI